MALHATDKPNQAVSGSIEEAILCQLDHYHQIRKFAIGLSNAERKLPDEFQGDSQLGIHVGPQTHRVMYLVGVTLASLSRACLHC